MKTAVIYARVSSSNDRQDTSRQIEDLKKYAISQDIEIVNIFQEHISGAKRIEERQILGECLEYCKRESVNILLLSELSRLGDRKSTRLNSSHNVASRMPSSA